MASQRSASRILLNAALDGALAAAAAPLARFIADPGAGLLHPLWFVAGGFITLLLGGLPFRLSQQYWRFAGISDLMGVVGGAIAGASLFSGLLLATGFRLPTVTFPLVHAFTLATLLAAPRIAYRLYHGRSRISLDDPGLQHVLLIGAGDAADGFLRALAPQRTAMLRVGGLLSMTERQTGRRMHGLPILGAVADAPLVLARLRARGKLPNVLVVTEPDFLGAKLAALITAAEAQGVSVRRAPPPTTLVDADRLTLKPVSIEDLLNREQVTLDHAGMARLIGGRRIAVTGAGGSIGSELARQVAALAPAELWLIDNSEYALWQVDLELSELAPLVRRRAVLADVRDAPRIGEIFAELRPELVFHAAALKHVPMVEANPLEGLLTNAAGTPRRRRRRPRRRRAGHRVHLHRQGGKSHQPHGCQQAPRRNVLPGAGHRGPCPGVRHALRHGPLRQRPRQHRQRGAFIPPPARTRRPAHRHPPRHASATS